MEGELEGTASEIRRGGFPKLAYQLGCEKMTGVLRLSLAGGKRELFVLRNGTLATRPSEERNTRHRLERVSCQDLVVDFDTTLAAYPPSVGRPFSLTRWARAHLEAQIDSARAQKLVSDLAGSRLQVVRERLPVLKELDNTDRRIIESMRAPRRLDQIWPIARAPRFRLLCFVHFLRSIGGLEISGVSSETHANQQRTTPSGSLEGDASFSYSASSVRRQYHALARALHPDLASDTDVDTRRSNERKLAVLNQEYSRRRSH